MLNLSAPASRKSLLLGGASFAAMLLMAPMAYATTFTGMTGQLVSQVPNTVATKPVSSGAGPNSPNLQPGAKSQSSTDFSTALARIQAQLSAQATARSVAVAGPNNLGTAAHPLVDVVDGLGPNGLNPVANPARAAQDTTGLLTWEGALAPTQANDASGNANVTIHQTQSRAILSWQSFNVGKKTTLNFDQQGNADWIALNRVVGADTAPSQILGNIKADGTVLVINQNGILFGGSSQVNVHSLIATSLEVGAATLNGSDGQPAQTYAQRDQEFLASGLLGYSPITFSPMPSQTTVAGNNQSAYSGINGAVTVQNGAEIVSGDSGYILLAAPVIENAGHLAATDGQVILAAGDQINLTQATGATDSVAPGVRGFLATPFNLISGAAHSVVNDVTGGIESPRGSIFLGSTGSGTTVNAGVLASTTSVSRNGAIEVSGANIEIAPGSTISIMPDSDASTIPQDPSSIAAFKSSVINIGDLSNRASGNAQNAASIDIGSNALILAPSATVIIGATPGSNSIIDGSSLSVSRSRVFVDSGAVIDVAGLEDVQLSASRNTLVIGPLKGNELAESPLLRTILNGATVTIDPRKSGVRDDGVAWIGSPLIDAASYYQQVGVSVTELMTKGGNISLGINAYGMGSVSSAPNVVVKFGATINISGGWVNYQAGQVQTTRLIDSSGHIVDIGSADPNDTFVGIYGGFTVSHPRWAITDTYTNSLLLGGHYVPAYTEGRDAGSLTVKSSAAFLDGAIDAEAFAGLFQISDAVSGTGTSTVYGDERKIQAAPSQLPAGGLLFIQAQTATSGGADILVQAARDHQALPSSLVYGQTLTIANDGSGAVIVPPARDPASILSASQLGTIALSDSMLSGSGFSQVSLHTSGAVTVAANANVSLNPGGVFDVLAGRALTIGGAVSVPSGTISLATFDSRLISPGGSVFSSAAPKVGDYDVVINGDLSTAGRWVNDFALDGADQLGSAWLDGGSITLYAAPRVSTITMTSSGVATPATATDLSGSIRVNSGALLDVSGGGRIDQKGKFNLTAKGGNLSLYDETTYFQIDDWANNSGLAGTLDGFRVTGTAYTDPIGGTHPYTPINPDKINARVAIDPGAIRAQGFGGGGTFTLTTPEFAFSDDAASTASANATRLPLSFFSDAGFANYDITSYKTDIFANPIKNNLGGTDALLATQTLTVGAGQNLNLTQAMLPSILTVSQRAGLLGLTSGGDLFSVLQSAVPVDAWDRKAANLTLGGLLELDVAAGGSVTGDAGAALTVSGLLNEGDIRIAGGTLTQQTNMPTLYTVAGTRAIHALSDIFSVNADGSITEAAQSKIAGLTNAQLAGSGATSASNPIYMLGLLDAGEGVELAPGSTTDLSGASIRNPHATGLSGQPIATGRLVNGGTLQAVSNSVLPGATLFHLSLASPYQLLAASHPTTFAGLTTSQMDVVGVGHNLVLEAGATLNISGASDVYDQAVTGNPLGAAPYGASPVWSDAGAVSAGAGAVFAGANILAQGGAPQAENGTLTILDPVLAQHDFAIPTANIVSADMLAAAGFDTLIALGSISNSGDATITLDRGFFLETRPVVNNGSILSLSNVNTVEGYVPTIRSGGGTLTINAPYAGFVSAFDTIATPNAGTAGSGNVVFNAGTIDFTGATLIDKSVANAQFNAGGDLRLTGVPSWIQTYFPASANNIPAPSLHGLIAANGNLTFTAGQIYPTTGSSFAIASAGANSTITFGRNGAALPDAPYSASGNLTVQAANIVQGGVIRVPLGILTMGGNAAFVAPGASATFAPVTQSVTLASGGVTSVSANGLVIPYGTTTDQTEWYFAPTNASPLTTPPQKLITLGGGSLSVEPGAIVDLSGGGDIYAYEFVPGTGGSRDVLNQLNPDTFTSTNGYQYADRRQVYAIVPGLSDKPVSSYDPIYDANYAALNSASQVGKRVWLDSGQGLAAGWYTLLPAQYAMLAGGMRVVEQTGGTPAPGTSMTLADGTLVTSGHYGDTLSGSAQSQQHLFDVQSQAVINNESKIVLTTGNGYFAAQAAHNGAAAPRLGIDAGRLVLNATNALAIDTASSFLTAAADGGLGSQVDIGGVNIDIVADLGSAPSDGALHLAASGLTALNADSLLVGGTRTDNGDGTTTLAVSAQNLSVQNNDATPLSAGEVLLAAGHGLTVADGAAISAIGKLSDPRTGAYQIGGASTTGTGALLRVANGPERLVSRTGATAAAGLTVGAATLSGNALLFDSSGTNSLSPDLSIQNAKFVAVGAPRIGFGADPATYQGLVITGALESLLTQGGAQLTLRSQSSIDFAGGTYDFGAVRFDAASLSGLDGGNVTISGDTVSLGNVDAAGSVCATCVAGNGTLAINANQILFTGGAMATEATILAAHTSGVLTGDITLTLPAGTAITGPDGTGNGTLVNPAQVIVSAGTAISLLQGQGVLPGLALAEADGTAVPLAAASITLPAGSYYFPNGAFASGLGNNPAGYFITKFGTPVAIASGTQVVLPSAPTTTQFFGGGVTLTAQNGVFAQGAGSIFDTGSAQLTIHAPYIGDQATALVAGTNATIPDLTLMSANGLAIDKAGAGSLAVITGIPGAAVTLSAPTISVSGTDVRATAGSVKLAATGDITLSGGAVIEAPGYAASFGDSADPVTQNAPGGAVTLTSAGGNIALNDATLSVGGGSGDAGALTLSAAAGQVDLGTATLNGTGGAGSAGGNFSLDSKGAIDLVALNRRVGASGFTGGFAVHTSTGDLALAADETLSSGAVSLTADGGLVDIAGAIDTSGINGGNVALYGRTGVTLKSTARVDASASGYGASDTRQAKGGDVTLGTDFISTTTNTDGSLSGISGAITVANGALIDVSARSPGARLVPFFDNGIESYNYVAGDQGGTITLRAPLVTSGGASTVNVTVANAGSLAGAREIDLVGVKRWDLAAVAASGFNYSGVTLVGNTVTLNAATNLDTANSNGSMTVVAGVNFLGDKGVGGASTLVDFVQNFDLSAASATLGGLATQANFHARPGIDLDNAGPITLASNWNLGAGVVNQDLALSRGAMVMDSILGKAVTVVGQEANLLANFTTLTYRSNHGSVTGEAPVVSFRAGGELDIKDSITDGFFQFRDQTDPTYLSQIGVTNGTDRLTFNAGFGGCSVVGAAPCAPSNVPTWGVFTAAPTAFFGLDLSVPTAASYISTGSSGVTQAPYSAIANSPAALGSFPQQSGSTATAGTSSIASGGDPLGSAVVFPLLPGGRVVQSSSYDLVAGADLSSADPRRAAPAILANLVVEGSSGTYSYGRSSSSVVHQADIFVDTSPVYPAVGAASAGTPSATDPFLQLTNWLAQFSTLYPGLNPNGVAFLNWGTNVTAGPLITLLYGANTVVAAPAAGSLLGQFIANNHLVAATATVAGDYRVIGTIKNGVYMKVSTLELFIQQMIIPNMAQIESIYATKANNSTPTLGATVTAQSTQTLVRTGTGDISVAASGNVDLTNGALNIQASQQVGGSAIYTAGHPADLTTPRTAIDPTTGQVVSINLPAPAASNLSNAATYTYGAAQTGQQPNGVVGVLIADPVYAEGGGDVDVSAGGDVLGRRDGYKAASLGINTSGNGSPHSWYGSVAEPWRSGSVGPNGATAAIDPQLFSDGLATLGGGDITVSAGRKVSDIAAISTGSMLTASATGGGLPTNALLTIGSGNVNISAGSDILGGRIDVASGAGTIVAGGAIAAAGTFTGPNIVRDSGLNSNPDSITNLMTVRITDATVNLSARDSITIQGVSSLGALQPRSASNYLFNNNNAFGLYSASAGLALVGDGGVSVANGNDSLIAPASANTDNVGNAVYPGSFKAASLTGDLAVVTNSSSVLLVPSPIGELELLAGGDIAPASIAMLDADPGQLPGPFSQGENWIFPTVFPTTSESQLRLLHNRNATHAGDTQPVRIYAGGDIGTASGGLILSLPKEARIGAGRDIINMMFFGQNLDASDITRITAGRDITATSVLTAPKLGTGTGTPQAALQGNTFVIGGPGTLMIEAGRDLGPFLDSVSITARINGGTVDQTYGGGILAVGNAWNPWLPAQSASLDVMFGVGGGANYDALRETYLDPANLAAMPDYLFEQVQQQIQAGALIDTVSVADRSKPIYGEMLVTWMQANNPAVLKAAYGTTNVSYDQAYAVFAGLPEITQRVFLDKVYFNELQQTAVVDGPSYLKYSRGYLAVNTLFPAADGYTQNDLTGGSNGANKTAVTGNLDLRLATIQTQYGGDIDIMGPGGRVLAGSTVRTAAQAARRTFDGSRLFNGNDNNRTTYLTGNDFVVSAPVAVTAIPSGYEGVLTLRGGDINTFTDGDFLLNQSRLFTEQGGQIVMWSSNADLNAGQGPKTSANFPPVLVKVSSDLFVQPDQVGATTGAGIAALQAGPDSPPSNVYLIAPRGTVDAGDAGIRVSGNLSIAALAVANADNIQVKGQSFGLPPQPVTNLTLTTASTAATEASTIANNMRAAQPATTVEVEVTGFGGEDFNNPQECRPSNGNGCGPGSR